MSVEPQPVNDDAWDAALRPAARATRAARRADAGLFGAIADFFLAEDHRLDERTRLMLAQVLRGIVATIETDIRRHAARLLAGQGATARAEALLGGHEDITIRLTRSGLLRDPDLMDELIARVRQDLVADALPTATAGTDEPSLLVRLADVSDSVVASAARALLAAESRVRAAAENGVFPGSDLPADLHHRLVWWIAAAIRPDRRDADPDPEADRAIAQAAQRSLAAHDEGERVDAVAIRLAAAIDARPDEIAAVLVEAIGDRRLALFVALLAHAIGVDYDQARAITLEPGGDRLWLALRAIDLDRPTIAQVALALADADPRRDIEAVADALDAIVAIAPADARAALAPLTLHRDFRAAIRAIARSDSQ